MRKLSFATVVVLLLTLTLVLASGLLNKARAQEKDYPLRIDIQKCEEHERTCGTMVQGQPSFTPCPDYIIRAHNEKTGRDFTMEGEFSLKTGSTYRARDADDPSKMAVAVVRTRPDGSEYDAEIEYNLRSPR